MENCIIKFLSGNANCEEIENLMAWRKESEENEELFQEYEAVWKISNGLENYLLPNKETVWKQIVNKIEGAKVVRLYSRSILIRIASVAAVVALVLGLSLPLLLNPNTFVKPAPIVVKAPKGQKTEVVLPDGSRVWLNSETVITYNTDFNRKERRVELDGEAFFDVQHNASKRFVVSNGRIEVVVHGTSFNVRSYAADSFVDVALLEGRVTICDEESQRQLADLLPNQRGTVDRNNLTCCIEECDAEVEALWKLNQLKIDGNSTTTLIRKLERWYGVEIAMKGDIADENFWLTIKDESLGEILDVMSAITPMEYAINGKKVDIRFDP